MRRPDLHHEMLRARHRMRSVATLTSGGRLPLRSLRARRAVRHRALRRAVHGPPRRGVVVAAGVRRAGAAHRRACSPAAPPCRSCAASTMPRSSACRSAAAPGCSRYRRAHDTETFIGTEATVRRWRENPLEHDDRLGRSSSSFIVVASRTMFDTRVPERRRVPAAAGEPARTGGPTSRRRGTRRARRRPSPTRPGGACCRSPACCGCSTRASG